MYWLSSVVHGMATAPALTGAVVVGLFTGAWVLGRVKRARS